MYTITISALKLNEILTAAKTMKCEYIYINEYGQTYGIDGFYIYKRLNMFIEVPIPLILVTNELINLLKTKTLNDQVSIQWGSQYSILTEEIESKLFLKNQIDSQLSIINSLLQLPVSTEISDIKQNPVYTEMVNSSASKGNFFIKLTDDCIISLYKGLLPVNKSDDILIRIRKLDDKFNFINFSILKKKNIVIDVYMKCCIL